MFIERWREHYNTIQPHSSQGYRPPAPQTIITPEAYSAPQSSDGAQGSRYPNIYSGTKHGGRPMGRRETKILLS